MNIEKSFTAYSEAQKYIPGGVNSPARAFKSVGTNPVFFDSAKGAYLKDINGNQYIDYVGSWGPMILGHANPEVLDAVNEAMQKGTSFGAPTLIETKMARLITEMVPSVERVRMVNSGTEATMSALRLARGYTGREVVVKFEGCYHGHGDSFLIKAGSGALTLGTPDSPGVTKGTAQDTLTAEYNNLEAIQEIFANKGEEIAAVILEPVTGNMGVVKPEKEFINGVRELCTKHGALLIFDEVMTGFRVAKGCAQELLDITPDITTFGKIIGGGLPVGAYGGKQEIMETLAPIGPVYQAGTLSGNPLAMAAGYTMLSILNNNSDIYQNLENKAAMLEKGILNNLNKLNFPGIINRVGSMMTLFFTESNTVKNFKDVLTCDTQLFADYYNGMLHNGIYFPPSQFEALFVSAAHSNMDIEKTIASNYEILKSVKK